MVKKKRYSQQQIKKRMSGKCFLCGEEKYELLDAHRIIEGGTYHPNNVLVLCAKCHRRVHSGEVKLDRKYFSTSSDWVVHFWIGDKEYWVNERVGFHPTS